MNIFGKVRLGGVFLVLLGTYFLLTTLGVLSWGLIGNLWPVVLIVVGLGILFRKE